VSYLADWILEAVNFQAFRIDQSMPPQPLKSLEYQFACWFCARPILWTQRQTVEPGFLSKS